MGNKELRTVREDRKGRIGMGVLAGPRTRGTMGREDVFSEMQEGETDSNPGD